MAGSPKGHLAFLSLIILTYKMGTFPEDGWGVCV